MSDFGSTHVEVSSGQEVGLTVQQMDSQELERSLIQQAADAWIRMVKRSI